MGKIIFKHYRQLRGVVCGHYYSSRWSFYGLKNGFAETNEINVTLSPETKSSLKIEVYSTSKVHDDVIVIDTQNDKYKMLTRTVKSPFGPDIERHFFKVTKTQGFNELVGYIIDELSKRGLSFDNSVMHFRYVDTDKMTIDISNGITNWED